MTEAKATADAKTVAQAYLAAWNAADPAERRRRVAETWTEDASYVDPMASVRGHDGLAALIEGVQARFPGFRFHLRGEPDGHGEHVRFSWGLGPQASDWPIEGTDVVAVAPDGRLASVVGFLDKVPA